jgi:hypothetical protein
VATTSDLPDAYVWALHPDKSYIYLFPRDCPRVTFYLDSTTSAEDRERFFAHTDATKVVAIENGWLDWVRETVLYRYDFAPNGFESHDESAGYWVSRETVLPLRVEPVGDLLTALAATGAEVRVTPSLWPLYEAVVASTLGFSIVRFRNAEPRPAAKETP